MAPTAANIFPMEQRYCAMYRFLMGIMLVARRTVHMCFTKIWRKGMGYLTPLISAGISGHLQNLCRWHQEVESFLETFAKNP